MAEASTDRAAPAATGTLASRPLVHLLVYARNHRLTGHLAVQAPDDRKGSFELWRGRIHDARTTPAFAYFGAVAYELGHIDTGTLDATLLEISRTKRLHGEVLVERGILTPLTRDLILAEQTCRKIHHLFSFPPESTFAFYDARPTVEEPRFTLDPIRPAWRGLRAGRPDSGVREVLARFGGAALRLANEGPLAQAELDPEESAVCEALLWKPMTLLQLRAAFPLPKDRLELLAYLLAITKCVEAVTPSTTELEAVGGRVGGAMRAAKPVDELAAPAATGPQGPVPEAPSSARAVPSTSSSARVLPASPSSARVLPASPSSSSFRAAPSSGRLAPAAPSSRPDMAAMPRGLLPPGGGPPVSGEVRQSLSFRVPSAPGLRSAASPSSATLRAAAQAAPAISPTDLGPVGIEHRAATIANEDPFTALGLPEGASMEAARASFFRLSKLWHPDRLPAALAPFRIEVERIFEHLARAHRTLTDPDARRDYLATAAAGAPLGAAEDKRARSEVLREIEAALVKREFHLAEASARRLVEADEDDADALALVAWATALAGEASEDTLRAALPQLDRAVSRDRDCERALYYRALLHKRLGDNVRAFRDFVRVVQLNPKHTDAQREIRIYEMRARKGSGEHAISALINKKK